MIIIILQCITTRCIPTAHLIKNNIPAHSKLTCDRVIATISFLLQRISNEDTFFSFWVKLLPQLIWHMNICNTAKYFQVWHIRLLTCKPFFRGHSMNCSCGSSVHNIYSSMNSFRPKMLRHTLFSHQGPCNFCNMPVFSFCNPILLWGIPACKLSLYPMRLQEITELIREILSPSIWPQAFNFQACFCFNSSLESFEVLKHITLFLHKIHPQLPWTVINKRDKIFAATKRCILRRSPNICMHNIKYISTYISIMWEGLSCLLTKLACFTNLMKFCNFEHRQTCNQPFRLH